MASEMSDARVFGLGFAKFGVIFTSVGVTFLFDKTFLAIGNILLLSGAILTAGSNFLKPRNYIVYLPFVCGFFLVIIGCPITGFLSEACGCFVFLFREFWPTIANFARNVPIIIRSLLRRFWSHPYVAPSSAAMESPGDYA